MDGYELESESAGGGPSESSSRRKRENISPEASVYPSFIFCVQIGIYTVSGDVFLALSICLSQNKPTFGCSW